MQGCTQTLLTKILDTATASLYSLKRRAISLASVSFYLVPSSTHFFVLCNTRVFFIVQLEQENTLIWCANHEHVSFLSLPFVHLILCLPVEGHIYDEIIRLKELKQNRGSF